MPSSQHSEQSLKSPAPLAKGDSGRSSRGAYGTNLFGSSADFSKFIVSIALGLGLGTAPLYLAECAPPSLRGALVNTCTVMVTLGTLFAGVANYGVSTMPPLSQTGLRILIGVQFAPPALMFATLYLIPER